MNKIELSNFEVSNSSKLTVIAGLNVLETEEQAIEVANILKKVTTEFGNPLIFKASFDKANRSSVDSYRGPGLKKGLEILKNLKSEGFDLITDIHEINQVEEVAEVVDVIQIPAFLCRQTDLIRAASETNKPLNIKKGQFLSPLDMINVSKKIEESGNKKILLTERGASFGYNNLISDMRSLEIMKSEIGYPVIFDATHSVQSPGGMGDKSGGDRKYVPALSKAATAVGVAGVFMETHNDPDNAPSVGPNMVKLEDMSDLIKKLIEIDNLVKEK